MIFSGLIGYALFIFWCCGIVSIFVDVDHIWNLFGKEPPVRFSDSFGRPFHTRTVFIIVAIIFSFIMVTFGNGFYEEILRIFGEEGSLLVMIILNVMTYYGSKRIGKQLSIKLYNRSKLNERLGNEY